MYSLLTALALGTSGCERDRPLTTAPYAPQAAQQAQRDSALPPNADTYIRQGNPNQNQGTELILRLVASGKNRALVRWDSQAVVGAIGGDSLVAARVELTITLNADNWGTTGRTIDLHRLTQAWTEAGATWSCADDTNPGNSVPDCTGPTVWAMDGPDPRPYVTTPSATRVITNGLQGIVTFDVTADVRGLSSGEGAQHGWILKKTDEGASGQVEFGSRESGAPPAIVLTLAPRPGPATWPILTTTLPDLDTSRVVALEGDSFLVFRTDITLLFKDGVSDSAKTAFFTRHSMTVVGVTGAGLFFVRIPDPVSIQSLYDTLDALEAEPEIYLANMIPRSPLPQKEDARLPTDGPGQARANWLSTSSSTWAMRAIYAPLAWGCETGDYGGAPVPVGIFEWKHQPTHPEFASSTPQLREPNDSQLAKVGYRPVRQDTVARGEAHATATTGLLTAQGDNESGIAGVSWRTRVFLYAGYSSGNRKLPLTYFYAPAAQMDTNKIRVLSISVDDSLPSSWRPNRRESLIRQLAATLPDDLLKRLPSLLIVVAAGNSRYRGTVTDYLRDPRAALLRGALLLLHEDPRYRDRIILVTGTRSGNRFWAQSVTNPAEGSNFFKGGATDIAAPAEDIRVLARWTGQTGSAVPLTTTSGTSLAAPLVAGVAAQLLTMEPNLTPAEVKHFILRGALEPRFSVDSGKYVTPRQVAGADTLADSLYQLDAYGALTLLSRERPDTPICGYPVSVVGNTIRLERDAAMGLVTPRTVAGVDALSALSVAQGGRRIAVRAFGGTAGSGQVRVLDHLGTPLETLGPEILERRYLERDILDVSLESRTTACGVTPRTVLTRHGPSGPARVEPPDRLAPSGVEATDVTGVPVRVTAVSPTGDRVAVAGTYGLGPDCIDTIQYRLDILSFDSAPDTNVANFDIACGGSICPILDQPGAWSHDGRRLLLPIVDLVWVVDTATQSFQATGVRNTRLVQFVNLGGRDTTFPGLGLVYPGFSADDSVATFAEFDQVAPSGFASNCRLTRRRVTDLTLLTNSPDAVALCQFFAPGPGQIFNLRTRMVATSAQPADAARVAIGTRSSPVRRKLPSTYVSGGTRRVQAN